MTWWRRFSPGIRRLMALALLAVLGDATTNESGAQQVPCVAYDSFGLLRNCTLSERLGQCASGAWDSWRGCVDGNGDGFQDVSWWMAQYCNAWAAFDLLACGAVVPWHYILPPPPPPR